MATQFKNLAEVLQAGIEHHKAGQLREAENMYRHILKIKPDNAATNHLMGLIAFQANKHNLAVDLISKAIKYNPKQSSFYISLGDVLKEQKKYDEAINAYNNSLKIKPDNPAAYNKLGIIFQEQGNIPDALQAYNSALKIAPDHTDALYNLGSALANQDRLEDALVSLNKVLAITPDRPDLHNNIGVLLQKLGKRHDAAGFYKRAIQINPENAAAQNNLGEFYEKQGQLEEALAFYQKALEIKPGLSQIYYNIAAMVSSQSMDSFTAKNPEFKRKVEQLLNALDPLSEGAMYLHFTLGKMYDHCDVPDTAFAHFQAGNRIKRGNVNYSPESMKEQVDQIIEFDQEFFKVKQFENSSRFSPIFIIGLSCSGKTLAERLLSTHGRVFAGDELRIMTRLIRNFLPQKLGAGRKFPFYAESMDSASAIETASKYEAFLKSLSGNSIKYHVNTSPVNLFLLGFIRLMFPQAKLIYCHRNALDTCLAIYFKLYVTGNEYAFDLKEIGRYYLEYERLMSHWTNVLLTPIYKIQYEDMMHYPEKTYQELMRFLDLERGKESDKALKGLLSSPNNKDSNNGFAPFSPDRIGWARRYDKFLAPLRKSLS